MNPKLRLIDSNQSETALAACALQDSAHITEGARGDHVARIQKTLNSLDNAALMADGIYGQGMVGAVLRYKQKRNIVNRSYQSKADNIVGKMTIAALDDEMFRKEGEEPDPNTCIRRVDPRRGASRVVRLAVADDDERKM